MFSSSTQSNCNLFFFFFCWLLLLFSVALRRERERERDEGKCRGRERDFQSVKVKEMNKKSLWLLPAVGCYRLSLSLPSSPLYFRPFLPISFTFLLVRLSNLILFFRFVPTLCLCAHHKKGFPLCHSTRRLSKRHNTHTHTRDRH